MIPDDRTSDDSKPEPDEPLYAPEFDRVPPSEEEIQGVTDFLDAVFGAGRDTAAQLSGQRAGSTWGETKESPLPSFDLEKVQILVVDHCEGVGVYRTSAPAELAGGKKGDPDVDFLVFNFVQDDGEIVALHFSLNAWEAFAELAQTAILGSGK